MVKIGVIGAGLMGRQHATSLMGMRKLGRAQVIGVAADDADQARQLAKDTESTAFASVEELLLAPGLDGVVIATPTDTHRKLAEQAIAAGKHIFVEKPISRTLEDATALVATANEAGLTLQVGHVIRYFDDYRRIGKAIADNDLGRIAVATFGRRCQQPDWAPDRWHVTGSRSGGVTVDMLIHDVDLIRWYFGEPSTVYARTIGPDKWNGLDYVVATLTVPDGPICHLHASWAEPSGFSQSAEVCGSLGMLEYDSRMPPELAYARHDTSADAPTALPAPPPGDADPFIRQMTDFVRAIETGEAPPSDGEWALASLRIALAMVESSDRRDVISLADIEVLV